MMKRFTSNLVTSILVTQKVSFCISVHPRADPRADQRADHSSQIDCIIPIHATDFANGDNVSYAVKVLRILK
jgi:hypothetical protein